MKRFISTLLLLGFLPLALLTAQESGDPVALLEYYSDPDGVEVYDIDGNLIDEIFFGMELMPGDRIKTLSSSAEIRLDPNGTIIKLSYNTEFTIEALQQDEQSANEFTLFGGKLRAIAAKIGLFQRNNYSIQTPSAVAGVRGTDFGLEVVPSLSDAAFVFEGAIEYTSLASGETLDLAAGQFADVFGDTFQAVNLAAEDFASLYQDLQFEELSPADVPGYIPPAAQAEPESEPEPEPQIENEVSESGSEGDDPLMRWMAEHLGMEIGTVTLNGLTFSKVILQPAFEIGKFDIALYLPVIYNTNLFDPEDWYKPDDNYEWSFGTDQDNPADAAADALRDLVLKIRYVEYGDNRDPLFFKIGNVNDVTLGHGILMNRFANDTDFPAVRRVGLNTGFNADKWTVESVVNDLAEPEIMAGRLAYRPLGRVFPLGFGLSSVVDIDPAGDLVDQVGDPIFVNGAVDTEFPLFDRDSFTLVGFADAGTMMPYYRENYAGIEAGWQQNFFYDDAESNPLDALRNYGYSAGILGNVGIMDYRLEYQYADGLFFNGFYGPTYERRRGEIAQAFATIVPLLDLFDTEPVRGIYGQAGFDLAWLVVESGYRWAWDDDGFNDEADLFHLLATIPTIPFVELSAALGMDTVGFVDGVLNGSLFDERTALYGELVYPLAETLKLAAVLTNTVSENADGIKEANFAVSIETRVSF